MPSVKYLSPLYETKFQPLTKGTRMIGRDKWQRDKYDYIVIGGSFISHDINFKPMLKYYTIPDKNGVSLLKEDIQRKSSRNLKDIANSWPYAQSLDAIIQSHTSYIETQSLFDN